MNREEIIKLAREAEFHVTGERVQSPVIGGSDLLWLLEHFAKLVEEHEREACAKLCEAQENRVVRRHPARLEFDPDSMMARKCAAVIRARSQA